MMYLSFQDVTRQLFYCPHTAILCVQGTHPVSGTKAKAAVLVLEGQTNPDASLARSGRGCWLDDRNRISSSVFSALRDAADILRRATPDDFDDHDLASFDSLAESLLCSIAALRHEKRKRPATVNEMAQFIAGQIAPPNPEQEKKRMKGTMLLPGGIEARVRRRAEGKCELCGSEYMLTPHHVIKRADGGLDHEDNLALLCRKCHNIVEDAGYNSRHDLLRSGRNLIDKPKTLDPEEAQSRADKAAATRATNYAETLRQNAEIEAWDKWKYATHAIPILTLEEVALLPVPLKEWHVWVYGGGHSRNAGK
jgi:hypothetical protein